MEYLRQQESKVRQWAVIYCSRKERGVKKEFSRSKREKRVSKFPSMYSVESS